MSQTKLQSCSYQSCCVDLLTHHQLPQITSMPSVSDGSSGLTPVPKVQPSIRHVALTAPLESQLGITLRMGCKPVSIHYRPVEMCVLWMQSTVIIITLNVVLVCNSLNCFSKVLKMSDLLPNDPCGNLLWGDKVNL